MAKPQIGHKSSLSYRSVTGADDTGSGEYTLIARVTKFTPAKPKVGKVDFSSFDSPLDNNQPVEESGPGWVDPGEWSVTFHYDATQHDAIWNLRWLEKEFMFLRPNGTEGYTFKGYIAEFGDEIGLKEAMTCEVKIQINDGSVQQLVGE